jgi:hypothetical protein
LSWRKLDDLMKYPLHLVDVFSATRFGTQLAILPDATAELAMGWRLRNMLYPLLLKRDHEGSIVSQWGASKNNRRARFYRLTATGRQPLHAEIRGGSQTAAILTHFLEVKAEDLS